MTILIKQYNPAFVFATLGIAFFGSYACITLYEQYRLVSKDNRPKLVNSWMLMLLMSFSLGGVAIWSMHFIAMSGVVFIHEDTREEVPVRYRVDLSLVSLAAVVLFSLVGLLISSNDRDFVLDEKDVAANYIEEVRHLSIGEIKKIQTKKSLILKNLFRNMPPILIGGSLTASGVVVMHYVGMMAMVLDGDIHWDYGIMTASILIALVASTAALWILFRLLALFPEIEKLRFVSAVIAACAVNGMHYTGMTAGTFHYVPNKHAYNGSTLSQNSAIIYSAIVAAVLLWVIFLVVIADLREWYHHLALLVRETDKLVKYHKGTEHARELFLNDYLALRAAQDESGFHRSKSSLAQEMEKVRLNRLKNCSVYPSYRPGSVLSYSSNPASAPSSGRKLSIEAKEVVGTINTLAMDANNIPRVAKLNSSVRIKQNAVTPENVNDPISDRHVTPENQLAVIQATDSFINHPLSQHLVENTLLTGLERIA